MKMSPLKYTLSGLFGITLMSYIIFEIGTRNNAAALGLFFFFTSLALFIISSRALLLDARCELLDIKLNQLLDKLEE